MTNKHPILVTSAGGQIGSVGRSIVKGLLEQTVWLVVERLTFADVDGRLALWTLPPPTNLLCNRD